jgi:hypothetical protein
MAQKPAPNRRLDTILTAGGTAAAASMFPWKEPKEWVPLAVRQIRSFLRAHRPESEKA